MTLQEVLAGLQWVSLHVLTVFHLYSRYRRVSIKGLCLLPAFIAAYLTAFVIKFIEKKVPEGLDLIVVIFIAPALVYGLASLINLASLQY